MNLLLAAVMLATAPSDYVFSRADLSENQVLERHLKAVGGEDAAREANDPLAVAAKEDDIELLGLSHVKGAPAYKLKITHADGAVTYVWLDKRTFVELDRAAIAAAPAPEKGSATAAADR